MYGLVVLLSVICRRSWVQDEGLVRLRPLSLEPGPAKMSLSFCGMGGSKGVVNKSWFTVKFFLVSSLSCQSHNLLILQAQFDTIRHISKLDHSSLLLCTLYLWQKHTILWYWAPTSICFRTTSSVHVTGWYISWFVWLASAKKHWRVFHILVWKSSTLLLSWIRDDRQKGLKTWLWDYSSISQDELDLEVKHFKRSQGI